MKPIQDQDFYQRVVRYANVNHNGWYARYMSSLDFADREHVNNTNKWLLLGLLSLYSLYTLHWLCVNIHVFMTILISQILWFGLSVFRSHRVNELELTRFSMMKDIPRERCETYLSTTWQSVSKIKTYRWDALLVFLYVYFTAGLAWLINPWVSVCLLIISLCGGEVIFISQKEMYNTHEKLFDRLSSEENRELLKLKDSYKEIKEYIECGVEMISTEDMSVYQKIDRSVKKFIWWYKVFGDKRVGDVLSSNAKMGTHYRELVKEAKSISPDLNLPDWKDPKIKEIDTNEQAVNLLTELESNWRAYNETWDVVFENRLRSIQLDDNNTDTVLLPETSSDREDDREIRLVRFWLALTKPGYDNALVSPHDQDLEEQEIVRRYRYLDYLMVALLLWGIHGFWFNG